MRQTRLKIELELKRRIVAGIYATGSRMPSHRQLQREFGGSSVTLQHAFDRLIEHGYVEARGTHGTFVAVSLPHISHIAVIFPEGQGHSHWTRYWSTAKRVAEDWSEGSIRFQTYCITGQSADSPVHHALINDVAKGVLAGLIFMTTPYYLGDSPLFRAALPRVCIGIGGIAIGDTFSASMLSMAESDIIERILQHFASQGRKRVAVINGGMPAEQSYTRYLPTICKLGLATHRQWWLSLPFIGSESTCARAVTHLLCSGDERQRPDCLIITDDNLVPHATAGIQDAGLSVPTHLAVAAHANFPRPTHSCVPCARYGLDVAHLLRTAIAEIHHLTHGGGRRLVDVSFELRAANMR